MNENTQLLTVRQFAHKHPFITQGGLRWLIYSNRLFREVCVRQLGRKVLLVEQEVMNFILQDRGKMEVSNAKFHEKKDGVKADGIRGSCTNLGKKASIPLTKDMRRESKK